MGSYCVGFSLRKGAAAVFVSILALGVAFLPAAELRGDIRFAVVSDFGSSLPGQAGGAIVAQIANQVKSWNPSFIVTAGDINHDGDADYDTNVGQYFHEYIGNYQGSYGAGAATNLFFPALGNHDDASLSAYRNYFTLPGNERYYDFQVGAARFFMTNSNTDETDGYKNTSNQAQNWLKPTMSGSTSTFNFVFTHHAPYTSSTRYYGGVTTSRWDYQAWGADAVFGGHSHVCERLSIGGLTYFVTGVSGEDTAGFNAPIAGSQFRYGDDYGFMVVDVSGTSATFRFVNLAGEVVETYTQSAAPNEWGAAGGGSFNAAANWTLGRYPSAPDALAAFRRTITAAVTIDLPVTVGALDLQGPGGTTLSGPAAIRMETTGSSATVSAQGGGHVVAAPLQLATGTTVAVLDNSLTISGPVTGAAGAILSKIGDGTLILSGENSYGGGTTVTQGTLLAKNTAGSGTGTGSVTVGAATLGGTGFINGPVTLTGDATLTSTAALTINNTLTVKGLANQLAAGTVLTSGDVTIEPGAVFIINGILGGDVGSLVVRGTLMGKGTINKPISLEVGGVLRPGEPSTIQAMAQILNAEAPRNFSFEIGAASPNYASPSNSINDVVRLTDAATPFADATGGASAALSADTVIDVYFLSADPALGAYKAEFFATTDFSDAVADATYQYWRLDPRGSRYHNGNFYSPLDESLVEWSVVHETATFDGQAASGYITEFTVVPEPATLALVVMGVAGTLLGRRRRFARG